MNLITHMSFGMLLTLLAAAIINPSIDPYTLNIYLLMAAVGSILPDVDHPKAYISKSHWLLHGGAHLIEVVAHHRGVTHSLLALVILTAAVYGGLSYFSQDTTLALPFALGILSHLIADSLNPTGVKWLQPFSQWTAKMDKKMLFLRLRINTGSLSERLLGVTLGLLFVYAYLQLNDPQSLRELESLLRPP
jgi:inner membrane protein